MNFHQPLDIHPSLNQGQFDIILPGDATDTPEVYVWDMTGAKIDINTSRVADRIETSIVNPAPGVYFVNVLMNKTLYTGKIVVQ